LKSFQRGNLHARVIPIHKSVEQQEGGLDACMMSSMNSSQLQENRGLQPGAQLIATD
jgi:hypothetical protein